MREWKNGQGKKWKDLLHTALLLSVYFKFGELWGLLSCLLAFLWAAVVGFSFSFKFFSSLNDLHWEGRGNNFSGSRYIYTQTYLAGHITFQRCAAHLGISRTRKPHRSCLPKTTQVIDTLSIGEAESIFVKSPKHTHIVRESRPKWFSLPSLLTTSDAANVFSKTSRIVPRWEYRWHRRRRAHANHIRHSTRSKLPVLSANF